MCQTCTKVKALSTSGNSFIDGVSYGNSWRGDITFAFTSSESDYNYEYEAGNNYSAVTDSQANCASTALEQSFGSASNDGFSVEGFTRTNILQGEATTATIRFGQSDTPATAYAYLPGKYEQAGDIWIGRNYDYTSPQAGNYAWHAIMHEIGHSLGLKHGHEYQNGFRALPASHDSIEFSIMTYRSYTGSAIGAYTYDQWSAPQTFMMLDIAALQRFYGADFTTNSGDTVYSWSPESGDTLVNGEVGVDAGGTVIFATIWDGGGSDTYDLSAYNTGLTIDIRAGRSSSFGNAQLADLGDGYSASGNVYNALMYNGDNRSLIENVGGGSEDDTIHGNNVDNRLEGGAGNDEIRGGVGDDRLYGDQGSDIILGGRGKDHIFGGGGNDRLFGRADADVFHFSADFGHDVIVDFEDGTDKLDLRGIDTGCGRLIRSAVQEGEDVVITLDEDNRITVTDFDLKNLDWRDFLH